MNHAQIHQLNQFAKHPMSLGNTKLGSSKVRWKIRYLLSSKPVSYTKIFEYTVWEKKKSVIRHAEMWETH